jgi:uncharacterized membrane protein YfcA
MEMALLLFVSFGASWLTFFCGFGLGTMLTPVFYLLFKDLPFAIAATTIVHFLNNIFKFLLMKRNIDWRIALPFGLAAIPAAILGALLVDKIENFNLLSYHIGESTREISMLNLIFGLILIGFAMIELIPRWGLAFSKKSLWFGGAISGFFGGLSGHQGALRTAFLIRYNLSKEVFIATGIVVALVIDVSRTAVYAFNLDYTLIGEQWKWILVSLLAALVGAITGKYFLKKIKFKTLNRIVAIAMLIFGLTLALGLLTKHEQAGNKTALQTEAQ